MHHCLLSMFFSATNASKALLTEPDCVTATRDVITVLCTAIKIVYNSSLVMLSCCDLIKEHNSGEVRVGSSQSKGRVKSEVFVQWPTSSETFANDCDHFQLGRELSEFSNK